METTLDDYGIEPAIDGDNLDVAEEAPKQLPAGGERASEGAAAIPAGGESEGLSLVHKLFFLGVIVSVCALFLHSRRGSGHDASFKQKSMA